MGKRYTITGAYGRKLEVGIGDTVGLIYDDCDVVITEVDWTDKHGEPRDIIVFKDEPFDQWRYADEVTDVKERAS